MNQEIEPFLLLLFFLGLPPHLPSPQPNGEWTGQMGRQATDEPKNLKPVDFGVFADCFGQMGGQA